MKKIHDHLIIGTGLSSYGAILALLKFKQNVTVVDPMIKYKKKENPDEVFFCEEGYPFTRYTSSKKNPKYSDLNKKLFFGGQSNFWAGNSLRFTKESLKEWPLNYEEFKKYYKIAEDKLNIINYKDDLSKLLQIKNNLKKIKKNNFFKKNKNKKIHIGFARLALKNYKNINLNNIINNNDIFQSYIKIERLYKKKKINLIKDCVVKICKNNNYYKIILRSNKKIYAKKIFFGSGVMNTKKILKKSFRNLKFKSVKQAQGFLIPGITLNKIKNNNILSEDLSSYQIVIEKNQFINHDTYFEVKFLNSLIKQSIKKKYGFISKLIPNFILKKIVIFWGFVHSDISFTYRFVNGKKIINNLEKKREQGLIFSLKKLFEIINNNSKIYLLSSFLKFTQFGRSYHIGSTIPMMSVKSRSFLCTNSKGELQLKNLKNIFIIDSSVFPTIPSGPMGLTLFANAFRVAEKSIKN